MELLASPMGVGLLESGIQYDLRVNVVIDVALQLLVACRCIGDRVGGMHMPVPMWHVDEPTFIKHGKVWAFRTDSIPG